MDVTYSSCFNHPKYINTCIYNTIQYMLQVIQFGNMNVHQCGGGERSPRPLHVKHPAAVLCCGQCLQKDIFAL